MADFEKLLKEAFGDLNIDQKNQSSINNYLNILKEKDSETYEHSIRVGKLGIEVANYLNIDPKPLFFSGTLHDIGKILIEPNLLKKTEIFTKEDMEEMRNHPIYSYKLLRDIHPYTANIALRHHLYQKDPYPEELPEPEVNFPKEVIENVEHYAKILSVIDCYDALKTRVNEKFGEKRELTPEEVKEYLLDIHLEQKKLITELYDQRIFLE